MPLDVSRCLVDCKTDQERKRGDIKQVVMPIQDVPAFVPIVHFLPPGYLRNPPVRVEHWTGHTLTFYSFQQNPPPSWKAPKYQVRGSQTFDVDSLARMLAKIGHALCIAEFGVDSFEHWLPPYILGTDPHLSYLVGGLPPWLRMPYESQSVVFQISPNIHHMPNGDWLVFALIELFAPYGSRPVMVIAGQTTDEFALSRLPKNT